MIILPNTRGHYPKGYPRGNGTGGGAGYDLEELEQATSAPDLTLFKTAIEEAQSDAQSYFHRNTNAWNWLNARWPGQTIDGRSWTGADGGDPFPWPGCSDTRVRLIERIVGQFLTLQTFAYRNMKVQAKATRLAAMAGPARNASAPATSSRSDAGRAHSDAGGGQGAETQAKWSEQNTTLINWLFFTHMGAELHRELRLGANWRNIFGSSVFCVDWEQERMLNYIDVNVAGLQDFVNEPSVQQFLGSNMGNIPIGEDLQITDLQQMIMDPAYADDLAALLKAVSHDYLTLKGARAKLDDLRELRTVQVPIPYVFKSRPRVVALRPMVDVIFRGETDDFQRAPLIDRVEFVSAVTLRDRIETAGYSSRFVEEALERRGPSSGTNTGRLLETAFQRAAIGGQRPDGNDFADDIELHHVHTLVHDRGVPIRFLTVMHMDLDEPAKHGPYGYEHGEACFHPQRFEMIQRPILSSRGIPEIAYTWEQEIKKQRDGRTDRVDLVLSPPIFTTAYAEMAKLKANYAPGAVIPVQRFGTVEKDKPPMWDPGSIEIEKTVEAMVREHFALFGEDVDKDLKQMRREELVDDTIAELKPVVQQIRKLCAQLLPEDEVAQVVGTLSRPFHISRAAIQGEYEMTVTVDLRDIDQEWAKERFALIPQIFATDTQGLINRTPIIKTMLGWLGYDLAESALPDDKQQVTEAEVQDEQRAIREIISSGADVELPKGGNAQLRLQTGQTYLQQLMQTNPVVQRRLQQNPEIMQIIQKREQGFQFQLQQIQNAQIGRLGTTQTFSKSAPMLATGPAT